MEKTKLIEKTNSGYLIRWDGLEKTLPYRPTIEVIRKIILALENAKIDQEILSGFVWKNMNVWLSSENQFNYKAAYDVAIQTQGANIPTTFKFGTTEEPVYYTFESVQDLSDFYFQALSYVNQTLASGWTRKDSINWEEWENAINEL